MCDATLKVTVRSRENHIQITEENSTIDILLIAVGTVIAVLVGATSYVAYEYYKQLRKAQKEYEQARNIVEDIVMSFNREIKREAEQIEAVSFRIEGTAAQAEAGFRKAGALEEKMAPLEAKVIKIGAAVDSVTSVLGKVTETNAKLLEISSNTDSSTLDAKIQVLEAASQEKLSSVDSKVRDFEASQESLNARIVKIEEKLDKMSVAAETQMELSVPPVIPIKRDKAMASLTETEVSVLEFLASEGLKTAPEIKEKVQLSREHTARLMKKLYEEGYLERETSKLPFKYSVKKEMEKFLKKPESPTA